MAKTFRQRPVEVQGVTWESRDPAAVAEVKAFVGVRDNGECRFLLASEKPDGIDKWGYLWVDTQRGWVGMTLGDTIVSLAHGSFYPISPEVMARLYEEV